MRLVTSSMDKKLILWDVEASSKLLSMSGHADCVYSCLFMPVCERSCCCIEFDAFESVGRRVQSVLGWESRRVSI